MHSDETKKLLEDCANARASIVFKQGIAVGKLPNPLMGLYLESYANCLLNRQAEIYDDAVFLLNNGKIHSACTVSRGMIETYAFAKYLAKEVDKKLNSDPGIGGAEQALKIVIDFTNSSRFKQSEQKKLDKGVFNAKDYHFTDQAKLRFAHGLASSIHVMNALRDLYDDQIKYTKEKESSFELMYDYLSEWVHPSQTSIFHHYTPETHLIPTSVGEVHLHEQAYQLCVNALHFLTDSVNVYNFTLGLAGEISKRHGT
ncbi:hypothetical protein YA0599_13480 [Pseudomonas syringae]|uniref:DUF5677 domain-containing protein n=1 Tax=Pseudomonas syringae TaxID=317 RepID=UPI0018E603FE|nr:DUF5677 domain-containing protein [Pseudomonas syringae]MBI6709238.1 hypothetical protein [Pseudomonas syringae]